MFRDWMRSRLGLDRSAEPSGPYNPMPVGPLRNVGGFKPGPFDSVNRPMGNTGVVPPHMQSPLAQNPMGSYNLEGSVGYGNPQPVPSVPEVGSGPYNPMPRRDDDSLHQRPFGRFNPYMW